MILKEATSKEMPLIYELYMEAFPANERKPFDLIQQKVKEGQMEMLAIEEEGKFVGLSISIFYQDMVLIDYFAMESSVRGQGLGTKALYALKERYKEKRMFLEIELLDDTAPNNNERIRRKAFYIRHGLSEAKVYVCLFGVDMELLTVDCAISYEEYHSIYERVFGKEIAKNIHQI